MQIHVPMFAVRQPPSFVVWIDDLGDRPSKSSVTNSVEFGIPVLQKAAAPSAFRPAIATVESLIQSDCG